MRFWDASAVVPLLVREPATAPLLDLLDADPELVCLDDRLAGAAQREGFAVLAPGA